MAFLRGCRSIRANASAAGGIDYAGVARGELPGEREQHDAHQRRDHDGAEGRIPAVALGQHTDALAFDGAADVTEEADEAGGGADGLLGAEVERSNAQQHDRRINEEANHGEEGEVEPEHVVRGVDDAQVAEEDGDHTEQADHAAALVGRGFPVNAAVPSGYGVARLAGKLHTIVIDDNYIPRGYGSSDGGKTWLLQTTTIPNQGADFSGQLAAGRWRASVSWPARARNDEHQPICRGDGQYGRVVGVHSLVAPALWSRRLVRNHLPGLPVARSRADIRRNPPILSTQPGPAGNHVHAGPPVSSSFE